MRLLASALLLLAGTSASGGTPTCRSALPPGFFVDGSLEEWRGVSSFRLDPSSRVARHDQAASKDDASARAWLALGVEGLAIAVEVRDDVVRFPLAPDDLASDHVEVHVAFDVPRIEMGDAPSVADCHAEAMGWPDEEHETILRDCLEWIRVQESRLAELGDEFLAGFAISPAGAVRLGPNPASGVVAAARIDGGYRLEALLPLSMLPRTGEAPLRHVRLVLDLIDVDDDEGQVTILSSSPRRDLANPATFDLLTLDAPVRYGAWPDWLERVMAKAGTSCRPAADVRTVETWLNPVSNPLKWPPFGPLVIVTIDLARQEFLGTLQGIELLRVESAATDVEVETELVSRRDGNIVDFEPTLGGVFEGWGDVSVRAARRGSSIDALIFSDGAVTRYGTGAGGGAPEFGVALVRMDATGHLSDPRELLRVRSQGEEFSWTSDADLTRVQIWMTGGGEEILRATITYDAVRASYVVAKEPSRYR